MPDTLAEIAETLERVEHMVAKTVETVGLVGERQKVMREDMVELKEHQKEANGNLRDLATEQHRMEGALSMLRWMVGATTAGVGAGAALAGVILALVS